MSVMFENPDGHPRRTAGLAGTFAILAGLLGLALAVICSFQPERPDDTRRLTPASASPPSRPWRRPAPTTIPGQMLLLNTDREAAGLLLVVQDHIKAKRYDAAIEILQPLVALDRKGFLPTYGGDRRAGSVYSAAGSLLGRMGKEGLEVYRGLYDAKARPMLEEARRKADADLLWRIVEEYGQTSFGPPALELVGAIQFDRGRFIEAAVAWENAYARYETGTLDRPCLLAKSAVAYHLGGEPRKAAEMLATLKARHERAEGSIGGQRQDLAAFAAKTLAAPCPYPGSEGEWHCLAGSPAGLPPRPTCRPGLTAAWTHPSGEPQQQRMADAFLDLTPAQAASRPKDFKPIRASLEMGAVSFDTGGLTPVKFVVPPAMHPVVTKGLVLYRGDREVVACDLATGRTAWQTKGLEVYPGRKGDEYRNHLCLYWAQLGDTGRCTLSVEGDRAFTVCRFVRGKDRGGDEAYFRVFHSTLAAISISQQGKVLWEVGSGQGDTEVVKNCAFLSAPTCREGRLYVLARHWPGYYAICLEARTGSVVWETFVGQDLGGSAYTSNCGDLGAFGILTDRAAPPTVAGDKVFVTANSGLVLALSATTGRGIWAYQYDTILTRYDQGKDYGYYATPPAGILRPLYPPNPIVAAGDRIICLPADGEAVLALKSDTGELLWQTDRRKQHDLTGIEESRVLLSGSGLLVLRTDNGQPLADLRKDADDIAGRPAVAADAVLACGKGRILRMDLDKYALTALPVRADMYLLGNLVCIGGDRLIAANLAGVCAFFR